MLYLDHIHLWVGNAYQAASYYTTNFGFEYYAYKGLLSGERNVATHVIRNGENTFLAFSSVYTETANKDMNIHLVAHGDGVKDVAFEVENAHAIFEVKNESFSMLSKMEEFQLQNLINYQTNMEKLLSLKSKHMEIQFTPSFKEMDTKVRSFLDLNLII